nr:3-oxoacyl-[acyl-carrier-protein] synthase III C-terminal domain-containing protein [Marinitoga lauensis]
MILRKDYNKNVILGTAFKGDGSFAEDCVIAVGGTKKWPMQEKDVKQMHFVVRNIEIFKKKLKERTMPNFYYVIDRSLEKSNLTRKDIDYLAILHFKRSAHLAVLEELGLNEKQTTYLEEYGHIGQNDQVLSIELGLKSGKIKEGDIIVMVGAGLGFVWAAATVKWESIRGDIMWRTLYKDKLRNIEEVVLKLPKKATIITGLASAEAQGLLENLHKYKNHFERLKVVTCLNMKEYDFFMNKEYENAYNNHSWFLSPPTRRAQKLGIKIVDFIPNNLHMAGTDKLMAEKEEDNTIIFWEQ